MRIDFHEIEVRRETLAKILVGVFLFNLVVMGAGAAYSYQEAPPIPDQIQGFDGNTVASGEQVQQGKAVFQSAGMMNHGSILATGAAVEVVVPNVFTGVRS